MSVDPLVYGYVANEENYPDKAVIIEEGTKGNWVYIVLEGRIKAKKKTPKGMVTIYTLNKGDIFGQNNLFVMGQDMRTFSVLADGPVKVGVLDAARLVRDYEMISPQLKGLIKSLTTRLNQMIDNLCLIATESK
ncbi:MAG TPA: hypothetical protein DDW42_05475 [Desulfobacteraceae bacterium]|nr:hypothetical protein [Desulfobacteraceae bacterium]